MNTDDDYSTSGLYLWASAAAQQTPRDMAHQDQTEFNQQVADIGDEILQYLEYDYVTGDPFDVHLAISVIELISWAERHLSPEDPRLPLLRVWEALAGTYTRTHHGMSEVAARTDLIFCTHTLLRKFFAPPEIEMYFRIIDLELIEFNWAALEQVAPSRAALLAKIRREWQEDLLSGLEPRRNQPALFEMEE